MDGVVRMGRIPGSMKKKTWIREGGRRYCRALGVPERKGRRDLEVHKAAGRLA